MTTFSAIESARKQTSDELVRAPRRLIFAMFLLEELKKNRVPIAAEYGSIFNRCNKAELKVNGRFL